MNISAKNWAWEQIARPLDKLVLLYLASNATQDFNLTATYNEIIAATGIGRDTLTKSIKRLVDAGLIERRIKPGERPIYWVMVNTAVAV